jgi:putative spermidine/putrescine transport system ATP-binding protein
MARVKIERLSKRYGENFVVKDLSLDIPQGEFLVLLGPSGCGKTTTLRMIAGFVEPTSGAITLGGRDVTTLPPWKRNTGLVFQSYALFPHLSVDENVAFGLEMRKIPATETRARVAEALRLVRLEGFGERLPRQLSGGQQQRVALARALAFRPDVLLLDEPLSNLDAKLREEVRVEIRELQQKLGLTTVMVTHDQDEALSMADRLVVMAQGEVRQIGTQRDLYERPAGRFVAGFVGRSNFLDGKVAPDGAFISAGGIRIACAAHAAGKGTLAIRPEAVSVGAQAADLDNAFEGVVEYISYLGAVLDVRVRLSPQDRIIVQIANRLGEALPKIGETLRVGWPATVGQIFAEDGEPRMVSRARGA